MNGEQFIDDGEWRTRNGEKGNRERNYAYIDILVDFSVNRNKIIETSQVCMG